MKSANNQKLVKLKTLEQLTDIVNTLRRHGIQSIAVKELEFEIRIFIIQQCNPRTIKFPVTKLPAFDGDFDNYKRDCLKFFNDLYEKKRQQKTARKKLRQKNVSL